MSDALHALEYLPLRYHSIDPFRFQAALNRITFEHLIGCCSGNAAGGTEMFVYCLPPYLSDDPRTQASLTKVRRPEERLRSWVSSGGLS